MTRFLLVALVAAATGCADAIVFGTGTMVGIEIKPAQDSQTEVNFAYSRQEITVFPMKPPRPGEDDPDRLAYSVYAWFRLTNRWLLEQDNGMGIKRGVCIRQLFATGKAAKNLAGIDRTKNLDPCREEEGAAE